MKKSLSLLFGLLVLAIWVLLYIYRPPETVSSLVYDLLLRFQAGGIEARDVVVLDIDERSLAEYGQWPWERARLAGLVDKLAQGGAKVVAFDILFIEEDRVSADKLQQEWSRRYGVPVRIEGLPESVRDSDSLFADSFGRVPTVLGCFLERGGSEGRSGTSSDPGYTGRFYELGAPRRSWLVANDFARLPLAELAEEAAGVGFINAVPGRDNVVRRMPLAISCAGERIYPSLGLEALRLFLGADKIGIVYDDKGVDGVTGMRVQDRFIPTDAHGRLLLNFRTNRFASVSAADVLAGRAASEVVDGKIVFVGTSAAALQDLVATPLQSEYPGVEVHCTLCENALAGDMLSEPRWVYHAGLVGLVAGGLLLVFLVAHARALASLLLFALAAGSVLAASLWMLVDARLLVNPALVLSGWTCVYLGVVIVKYWEEQQARRRVRAMFGTMVSSSVLEYLETTPESFSLRGERVPATVMFSDLADFTAICENMPPDRLSALLNRYLSPMTEIIMRHEGYVDKFEGDAIMAEWGVPFQIDKHAHQACAAVLEQRRHLDGLRDELCAEFGFELHARFGVNTGELTAGNMGSDERFQYTVMGDVVNQAARMESINKMYGTEIIVGAATSKAVADEYLLRRVDRVRLLGKSQAVEIYELLGRKGELSPERMRVVNLYTQALEFYFEGDFESAIPRLQDALDLDSSDGPARVLIRRLRRFKGDPPPADWDGVYSWDLK